MEREAKRRASISTDVKIQLVDIKKCEGVNIINDTVRGAEDIQVIETLENRIGLKRRIKNEPRCCIEGEIQVGDLYGSSSSSNNVVVVESESQDTPVPKMASRARHPLGKRHQLKNKEAPDDADGAVSITGVVPMESGDKKRSPQQKKRNQRQTKERDVGHLNRTGVRLLHSIPHTAVRDHSKLETKYRCSAG